MDSYDFSEKAKYRTRVWMEIEKQCSRPKALRRVVYLDTREALETKFLLARGYDAANLLAVNREPIEVALLTKELDRCGLPRVKTAGVEWERAVGMLGEGRADIVNFDGTGNLSTSLIELMRSTLHRARPKVLAVNMLGGRESGDAKDLLTADGFGKYINIVTQTIPAGVVRSSSGREVNATHLRRIAALLCAMQAGSADGCHFHADSIKFDTYMSTSGQPMVWAVFGIRPHAELSVKEVTETIAQYSRDGRLAFLPRCLVQRIKEPAVASYAARAWRARWPAFGQQEVSR